MKNKKTPNNTSEFGGYTIYFKKWVGPPATKYRCVDLATDEDLLISAMSTTIFYDVDTYSILIRTLMGTFRILWDPRMDQKPDPPQYPTTEAWIDDVPIHIFSLSDVDTHEKLVDGILKAVGFLVHTYEKDFYKNYQLRYSNIL